MEQLFEFAKRLLAAVESIAESLTRLTQEAVLKDPYRKETDIQKAVAERRKLFAEDAIYTKQLAKYREDLCEILNKQGIQYNIRARLATLESLIISNIENAVLPKKPVRTTDIPESVRSQQEPEPDPVVEVTPEPVVEVEVTREPEPVVEVTPEPEPEPEPTTTWGPGDVGYEEIMSAFKTWCRANAESEQDIRAVAVAKLKTFRVDKFSQLTKAQALEFRKSLV